MFNSFYFDITHFLDLHNLSIFLLFQVTTSQSFKTKVSKGLDDSDEDMPISSSFKPPSSAQTKRKVFQETLRKIYFTQTRVGCASREGLLALALVRSKFCKLEASDMKFALNWFKLCQEIFFFLDQFCFRSLCFFLLALVLA